PLPHVALHARAHDVLPGGFTPSATWHDMVDAQLAGYEMLPAVLTTVAIASKQVATVKADPLLGNTVVVQQSQDPRDLNLEVNASDPVFVWFLVICPQFANLAPRLEVVICVLTIFNVNNFGQFAE